MGMEGRMGEERTSVMGNHRRTKIVCTIGPASCDHDVLQHMMQAGMDVARLNLSHGTHEDHARLIERIRCAARTAGCSVALMLDTQGPEIRTGPLRLPEVELRTGARLTLTTEGLSGDAERVGVTYAGLPQDVEKGVRILVDDGLIELEVEKCTSTEVYCRVVNGGVLRPRKGINIPGVSVCLPSLTEKDWRDLEFGVEQGVDFIAASFVRRSQDVLEILHFLEEKKEDIDVIAKIETQEGVTNSESILEVADGLMVARGDLGVEIPVQRVPLVQKKLIRLCNQRGKPVIIATQMLDSMQRNPRPTRAEASDVANAILDGTDAVMLSGETASGAYPVRAVQMMADIALHAEASIVEPPGVDCCWGEEVNITDALGEAVVQMVDRLSGLTAILTATESGFAARTVSKYRPRVPIVAVTPNESVIRKLALVWGVYPVWGRHSGTAESMLQEAVSAGLLAGYVEQGSLVVVTAGVPLGRSGTTNLLKVHVVGGVLARGRGVGARKIVSGPIVMGMTVVEMRSRMVSGAVVVVPRRMDDMVEEDLKDAAAIVIEAEGLTSHAAVVGLNLGIPVIVGVEGAVEKLGQEEAVTIDVYRGHIFSGKTRIL
ncbi:pyruvate kinase [Pasteuria penetrans]|uniref:pyruvate kinase n=1 Tax=Pasteuria penetrans TaxID=86005 RepID=UPI000F91DEA6|nr:pyruvate kinase [Pasteuria penetrans]